MLKKASRNSKEDDVSDVRADNPKGTMRRFDAALRKVLSAPKASDQLKHREEKLPTDRKRRA